MRRTKRYYNTKIICFDFDGTITKEDLYPEIGKEINEEIKTLINDLFFSGYKIIINSARDTIYFDQIKDFLYMNDIYYHEIHLKCKPTADLYIDDKSLFGNARDLRFFIDSFFYKSINDLCNGIAQEELYNNCALNIYDVPENHLYCRINWTKQFEENSYKVILPLTGGMDSMTLYKMAEESKIPFVCYYVDMGQKYSDIELQTIKKLLPNIQINIIKIDINFRQYKHILTGRNAVILLKLAEEMKKNNWWGDIWFGNLQGESPILGGDKSQRFFHDMTNFFVLHGYDVRICNPLIGIDKFDEVSYWNERDINILRRTRSCFDTTEKECGRCQSCFRKFVAFKYHGIDIRDQFEKVDFSDHIKKYEKVLNEALKNKDFTHYSEQRIIKTLKVIDDLKLENIN